MPFPLPQPASPFDDFPTIPRPIYVKIPLFVFNCLFLPVKLILMCFWFVLLSVVCRVLMVGVQRKINNPTPHHPIRRFLIQCAVRTIFTCISLTAGVLVFVHYPPAQQSRNWLIRLWQRLPHPLCHPVAPPPPHGLMVSNHIGLMDALIYAGLFPISLLSKFELHAIPTFGVIGDALECLFVKRAEPESRAQVANEMISRIKTRPNSGFLMFPEGTSTNGRYVLRLQKGIFAHGLPVTPLGIRCNYRYWDITWPKYGMSEHVVALFSCVYHIVDVYVGEQYVPSAAELIDPILYASNVQRRLASLIDVPCTSLSMYDNPELTDLKKAKAQ